MKVVCMQPRFLQAARRAQESLPEIEGEFFFLGITGNVDAVYGNALLPFKEQVEKTRGIVLYLDDMRFKGEKARDLTNNIKFFIDGLEHRIFNRNVLIIGCPVDQAKSAERYILNEDRWPHRNPEAEQTAQTILDANTESKGDSNT